MFDLLPDPQAFIDYLNNGGLVVLVVAAVAITELALVILVFLTLAQISTTAGSKKLMREMREELRRLNLLIEKATAEEDEAHEPLTARPHPSVVPGPGHHLHGRKPR